MKESADRPAATGQIPMQHRERRELWSEIVWPDNREPPCGEPVSRTPRHAAPRRAHVTTLRGLVQRCGRHSACNVRYFSPTFFSRLHCPNPKARLSPSSSHAYKMLRDFTKEALDAPCSHARKKWQLARGRISHFAGDRASPDG